MNKSLKTLTRIQKFHIDEQRKKLVEQLEKEEQIINNIKLLDAKYEEEKAFQAQNGGIGDFGAYVKRYLDIREEQTRLLLETQRKIAEIREIIADMFKEQKTYEIVDEQRHKRAQKELSDKEQKMLDEIGTNTYIKHKQQ